MAPLSLGSASSPKKKMHRSNNGAKTSYYLLTADVGGTNSRMGLYTTDDRLPLVVKTYRNQDIVTAENAKEAGIFEKRIIAPFLQHCWETQPGLTPLGQTEIIACLAIAGPVHDNQVVMSNLHNIVIDGTAISKQLNSACKHEPYLSCIVVCQIINDFVAQGYGCLTLQPDEVQELVPGSLAKMNPQGPKVCVGAGTGLGECYLTPSGDCGGYTCYASEGGHVEWAPRDDELQVKLFQYLKKKFHSKKRVSVERIVSGKGLANVYAFLAETFPSKVHPDVHAEFEAAGDMQGKVVSINAKPGTLCEQAMAIMMSAYGSEVGASGIKFIPTGGLYVTGGLTPKNLHFIEGQDSCFMKAYHDKGRAAVVLEGVPLLAVLTEDLGVRGALKNAQIEFEKHFARRGGRRGRGMSSKSLSALWSSRSADQEDQEADQKRQNSMLIASNLLVAAAIGMWVGVHLSKRK